MTLCRAYVLIKCGNKRLLLQVRLSARVVKTDAVEAESAALGIPVFSSALFAQRLVQVRTCSARLGADAGNRVLVDDHGRGMGTDPDRHCLQLGLT